MRIPIHLTTLAILLSTSLFAQDRPRCGDYYVRPCPCPKGCAETYCEKLCKLAVDAYPRCGYTCSSADCTCGAYGKNQSTSRGQLSLCNPFVASAFAGESIVSTEEVMPAGVEEVKTPHGDFIVTDETIRRGDESGSGSGIGVQVGESKEGIVIKKVLKGSPAEGAGLAEGDLIVAIDLGAAGIGSTKGMSLKDAIQSLRGKPGTLVALQIRKKKTKKVVRVGVLRTTDALSGVETKGDKASIRRLPQDSKSKACSKTSGDCHLLFPSDGECVYSCPTE